MFHFLVTNVSPGHRLRVTCDVITCHLEYRRYHSRYRSVPCPR